MNLQVHKALSQYFKDRYGQDVKVDRNKSGPRQKVLVCKSLDCKFSCLVRGYREEAIDTNIRGLVDE